MADTTLIEWARHPVTGLGATWNPITGCSLVSEGCRHCYAAKWAGTRLKNHPSRRGLARKNADGEWKFTGEVRFNEQWLEQPLHWRKPRGVFVVAHGDLFHEGVRDARIDDVFSIMATSPQHVFFVLTKRPERARKYLTNKHVARRWRDLAIMRSGNVWDEVFARIPLPNVWLGTSIEDQATADTRIPHLLATPAARRFISAEPLLGPVDLTAITERDDKGENVYSALECDVSTEDDPFDGACLDWVIAGGESSKKARPMHPDWVRSLRDQCAASGTSFFFKQWGQWAPPDVMTIDDRPQMRLHRRTGKEPHLMHVHPDGTNMGSIGVKASGHLLDGIEHNAMPELA